jgi:hypothetical protein
MQFAHFIILILALSMLWNLPFTERVLSGRGKRPVGHESLRKSAEQFNLPPSSTKGNKDVHAIRDRLRQLKLRVCGAAC